jgi:putative transposase
MKKVSTPRGIVASGLETAWENVAASFERFCLTAGVVTLADMLERDTVKLCGPRHGRSNDRHGYRWGRTAGKLGFHGGKVAIERPRVRGRGGAEVALPSWEAAQAEDWLGRWAMRGRHRGHIRGGAVEVCGVAPVRGVVGRTDERMASSGPVAA